MPGNVFHSTETQFLTYLISVSDGQSWRVKHLCKNQSISNSSEHTVTASWQETLLLNTCGSFQDYKMTF